MKELIKTLCAIPGVSGDESAVRDFILEKIRPLADEVKVDAMGSIIAFKKGRKSGGKKILLAAHMDEVGVIITHVTEDGFLKFAFAGGVDRRVVIGKKVYIGKDRVPGVIGLKAHHHVSEEEEKSVPKVTELYIDVGADTKEQAEKLVRLGDTGAFSPECVEFGSGMLKAKALDDRVGCAVLIKLMESELSVDTWFAFTVQEEVGTRGALAAAYSTAPDIALIVEGTTAADLPTVAPEKQICSAGAGVVIPFMDGGTIYDRELYDLLTKTAEEKSIRWQTKEYISGGTDASAIQRSRAGVKTAGIAVAVRYIHSPSSVIAIEDAERTLALAKAFLEKMGD